MTHQEFVALMTTFEQDHELVLHETRALKTTVSALLEPGTAGPRPLLERLREANDYFTRHFAAHMAEEERTLFPFLQQHSSEGVAVVAALKADHAKITQLRQQFADCLQLALELEDGPPRQVLRDLATYGLEFWEVLNQHAHAETQAARPFLGQSLTVLADE